MAELKISEDLANTLQDADHIEEVYFTKSGDHFFNVHELLEKKKPTGKFYGRFKMVEVKTHAVGDRQFFKKVPAADPSALIVKTLTREEVLALYKKQQATKVKAEPVDA